MVSFSSSRKKVAYDKEKVRNCFLEDFPDLPNGVDFPFLGHLGKIRVIIDNAVKLFPKGRGVLLVCIVRHFSKSAKEDEMEPQSSCEGPGQADRSCEDVQTRNSSDFAFR